MLYVINKSVKFYISGEESVPVLKENIAIKAKARA